MKPSRIRAVEHVLLEARPGLEEALRWFYGALAALEERPVEPGAGWVLSFRSERIELRVFACEEPRIDPLICRVTLAVPSLTTVQDELTQRRWAFTWARGFLMTDRRIETEDPAGHRVAFKQAWRPVI